MKELMKSKKDIDTLWTFDFAEYNIRPGSGFIIDDVFKKMHDLNLRVRD